ncbi:MAG: hypothetical protein LBO72_06335, partial [Helicobacteraceae bacterium]|nr:hypothetical protein [Helicobacteraceae bacterium]
MPKSLPRAAHVAASLFSLLKNRPQIGGAIVKDDKSAYWCADAIKALGREVFALPDLRADFGDDLRSYQSELIAFSEALGGFYASKREDKFLIAPIASILKPIPSPKLFETITLNFGDTIDITALQKRLIDWGYDMVDTIEQKGEASFRGEVIDIFCAPHENAIRILLDQTQIESIRYIDIATQKSEKTELESVAIRPALFAIEGEAGKRLRDLIASDESDAFIKDALGVGLWKLPALGLSVSFDEIADFCLAEELSQELDELYINHDNMPPRKSVEKLLVAPEIGAFKALLADDPKTLIEFHKTKQITIALAYETQLKANAIDLKNAPKNA